MDNLNVPTMNAVRQAIVNVGATAIYGLWGDNELANRPELTPIKVLWADRTGTSEP